MRILFTRFPLESAHGGAEVQTISLMRGLKEKGHDVSFLGSCHVMLKLCEDNNIPAKELIIGPPPVTKWKAASFLWRQISMRKKLLREIQKGKYNAIVMMSLSEKLLFPSNPSPDPRPKIFWLEHDPIGRWLTMNPWLHRLRRFSRDVTTICVSELSKRLYVQIGWPEDRVIAIPNGIDLERFRQSESRNTDTQYLKLGCVARLADEKGVDVLIRALKHLSNAHLTIIGKGPEETMLRKLIKELNLGERVSIEKQTDNLGEFYQSIDCLILPSRQHDPFGLVAAEVMALGIPVVVTDACGIADYLDATEAIVIPPNSQKALEEAILKLSNPELRTSMGRAGMEAARVKFSVEKMIDSYDKLLTDNREGE